MADVELTRINLEVIQTKRLKSGGHALADLVKGLGLHTQTQEAFWVIAYGKNGHLYRVVEVARGFHEKVDVDLTAVFTAVVATSAPMFSVAHNHPTMLALPSRSDYDLTAKIAAGADTLGLAFEDHVIVEPGGDYYSYADAGMLLGTKRTTPKAASRRRARD